MSNLNSADIRTLIATCEADVAKTGQSLTEADAAYKTAVRAALLNGSSDEAAQADAITAASAHHRATDRLQTARQLLTEALAAEKAAADAKVRAEIRAVLTEMQDISSKADDALSAFITSVERLRQLEHTARTRSAKELHQDVFGGVMVPTAYSDTAVHLKALRNGHADQLKPIVAEKVSMAVRSINDVLGA